MYAPWPQPPQRATAHARSAPACSEVRAPVAPDVALVALSGEYDLSTLDELEASLAAASVCANVVVDLAACSFMDVTTVSALAAAQMAADERGGQIALVLPPSLGPVSRLTRLTGLAEIVPGFATLPQAIAHLQQMPGADRPACAGAR